MNDLVRLVLLSYIFVTVPDKHVPGGLLIQIDQETQDILVEMSIIYIIEPSQDCDLAKHDPI